MPGVIALVDGTHMLIKNPENEVEQVYFAVRIRVLTVKILIIFSH